MIKFTREFKNHLLENTIVLLGYMGCGKTRVGVALSQRLDIAYVDLDSYIEEQEKTTVKNIFDQKGELYFRALERKYLEQLLALEEPIILALGGGTPCYYDSMEYIVNSNAISFYLKASILTLTKRLSEEKSKRPLISHIESQDALMEYIGKHLFERLQFYAKASHVIAVDTDSPDVLAEKIQDLI
jgi:shikimate kinase